jgi:serine protease Do
MEIAGLSAKVVTDKRVAWLLHIVDTGRPDWTRCPVIRLRSVDVRRRTWPGLIRRLARHFEPSHVRWTRSRPALGVVVGLLALGAGCTIAPLGPPTREHTLAQVLPSAAQVIVEQGSRRVRSASGVVLAVRPSAQGPDCYVLTSGHTLARGTGEEAVSVLLSRHDGPGVKARATILAQRDTPDLDLGLLRVSGGPCTPAELGEPPVLGAEIWVVAFPWGRHLTLVSGIVSQLNRQGLTDSAEPAPQLMVDASVSYGSSGGGVYEVRRGRLVGLVESYRTARVALPGEVASRYIEVPSPGETNVTPLSDIRRFLIEVGYASLLGSATHLATPGTDVPKPATP